MDVDIAVAISRDGQVAAILGSRDDYDDDTTWYGNEQYIGAMTIITKTGSSSNGSWSVVGKGTRAENIGVFAAQNAVLADHSTFLKNLTDRIANLTESRERFSRKMVAFDLSM